MMPFSNIVCERARGGGVYIRLDGLVEDDGEMTVVLDTQLPRITASLDSAIVGRRIRRPVDPGGDGEIPPGYRNRGSCDPVSRVEVPRFSNSTGDIRRAGESSVISVSAPVLHPSVLSQG